MTFIGCKVLIVLSSLTKEKDNTSILDALKGQEKELKKKDLEVSALRSLLASRDARVLKWKYEVKIELIF